MWLMVASLLVDVFGVFLFNMHVHGRDGLINYSVNLIIAEEELRMVEEPSSRHINNHRDTFAIVFFHAMGHALRNAGVIFSAFLVHAWF